MIRTCGKCGTKYNDDSVGNCPACWNAQKQIKGKTKYGYLKKNGEKIDTYAEEKARYFGKR